MHVLTLHLDLSEFLDSTQDISIEKCISKYYLDLPQQNQQMTYLQSQEFQEGS